MINLLPPDIKENYRFARRNRILARWVTAASLCLLGAGLLLGGGYLYLNQSIKTTQNQITDTANELESQHLNSVQQQVTSISNNLKLTVQVLSKEILFSELLKQLASVTPSNVILTNLSITQAQGSVDIVAQTANYDAATQLQVNLADPKNQIFSKADIVGISCNNTGTGLSSQYPCTATIRALFATNNPFLFINKGGK